MIIANSAASRSLSITMLKAAMIASSGGAGGGRLSRWRNDWTSHSPRRLLQRPPRHHGNKLAAIYRVGLRIGERIDCGRCGVGCGAENRGFGRAAGELRFGRRDAARMRLGAPDADMGG